MDNDKIYAEAFMNNLSNNVIKPLKPYQTYISDSFLYALAQNKDRLDAQVEKYEKDKAKSELLRTQRKNKELRALVKHVNWSGNTCIVYWNDNTYTTAHWDPAEDFDPEKAILVCMARKLYQNTNIYNEVLQKYEDEGWRHWENEYLMPSLWENN